MSEYDYDGDEEDYDDYEWTYIEDHYDDAVSLLADPRAVQHF